MYKVIDMCRSLKLLLCHYAIGQTALAYVPALLLMAYLPYVE